MVHLKALYWYNRQWEEELETSYFFFFHSVSYRRISILVSKRTSFTSEVHFTTNHQLDALSLQLCDFYLFCSFWGQGHGAKGENEYEFSLEFLKPVKPEVTSIRNCNKMCKAFGCTMKCSAFAMFCLFMLEPHEDVCVHRWSTNPPSGRWISR